MSATFVPDPVSPRDGPEDPSIRLAEVMTSTIMEIEAPSIEAAVTAEFDGATAAGKDWAAQAGKVLESPQGFGSEGYMISLPDPDHDEPWSSESMMFPHQGP
jgi:hypothetical protein